MSLDLSDLSIERVDQIRLHDDTFARLSLPKTCHVNRLASSDCRFDPALQVLHLDLLHNRFVELLWQGELLLVCVVPTNKVCVDFFSSGLKRAPVYTHLLRVEPLKSLKLVLTSRPESVYVKIRYRVQRILVSALLSFCSIFRTR